MIANKKTQEIKKLKREALILRNLMIVLSKIGIKSPLLSQISFTKASLDGDRATALIFIHSSFGKDIALSAVKVLISYEKQIHAALCSELQFRYMPKLKFVYDMQYDKMIKINELIEKANQENSDLFS